MRQVNANEVCKEVDKSIYRSIHIPTKDGIREAKNIVIGHTLYALYTVHITTILNAIIDLYSEYM